MVLKYKKSNGAKAACEFAFSTTLVHGVVERQPIIHIVKLWSLAYKTSGNIS